MHKNVQSLSPLANKIVDKSIDNITRKLVVGGRNRSKSRPSAKSVDIKVEISDLLKASNTANAIDIAKRTTDWREVITKSFSHGVSSLSTIKFDSEFTIAGGEAKDLKFVHDGPGVYVVYDKAGNAVYVGDAERVSKRWVAGHLNEYKQKAKLGQPYKLAGQIEEGCIVKVLHTDSKETAAAIEANLIANHKNELINNKDELKNTQGTRSNIEAKKMKERLNSAKGLVEGAVREIGEQSVLAAIEGLLASAIKHLKLELVDLFKGGDAKLAERVQRFFQAIIQDVKNLKTNLKEMLKGVFDAVIGLISQTISQVYNLARNIFDLAANAYNIYKNKDKMSTEEVLNKTVETIVISGSLALWSSLDVAIEGLIFPFTGVFTGIVAGIISAIGFGITSHLLSKFVPSLVKFILGFGVSHQIALEERKASFMLLVDSYNINEQLYGASQTLLQSELRVAEKIRALEVNFTKPSTKIRVIEKRDFLSQLDGFENE